MTEKTWEDCKSAAANNGFTFASIQNQQENNAVADYLEGNNIWSRVWLGGYQTSFEDEPAGNWAWLERTAWTDSTYTNWASSEPNNRDNDEHHLYLWSGDGTWRDGNKDGKWPCIFRDPTWSFMPTQNPSSSSKPTSRSSQSPSLSFAPTFIDCSCGPGTFKFQLELKLDRHPIDLNWDLKDENELVLYNGGSYNQFLDKFKTFNYEYCLPVGCYDFTIQDSHGDGLSDGGIFNIDGYYKGRLYWREDEIFSGINFGFEAIESFCGKEGVCP